MFLIKFVRNIKKINYYKSRYILKTCYIPYTLHAM